MRHISSIVACRCAKVTLPCSGCVGTPYFCGRGSFPVGAGISFITRSLFQSPAGLLSRLKQSQFGNVSCPHALLSKNVAWPDHLGRWKVEPHFSDRPDYGAQLLMRLPRHGLRSVSQPSAIYHRCCCKQHGAACNPHIRSLQYGYSGGASRADRPTVISLRLTALTARHKNGCAAISAGQRPCCRRHSGAAHQHRSGGAGQPGTSQQLSADWLPPAIMSRVIVHWTAGNHRASGLERSHYHVLIESDAKLVKGIPPIALNDAGGLKAGLAARRRH
jgi:hypothetical protein